MEMLKDVVARWGRVSDYDYEDEDHFCNEYCDHDCDCSSCVMCECCDYSLDDCTCDHALGEWCTE